MVHRSDDPIIKYYSIYYSICYIRPIIVFYNSFVKKTRESNNYKINYVLLHSTIRLVLTFSESIPSSGQQVPRFSKKTKKKLQAKKKLGQLRKKLTFLSSGFEELNCSVVTVTVKFVSEKRNVKLSFTVEEKHHPVSSVG